MPSGRAEPGRREVSWRGSAWRSPCAGDSCASSRFPREATAVGGFLGAAVPTRLLHRRRAREPPRLLPEDPGPRRPRLPTDPPTRGCQRVQVEVAAVLEESAEQEAPLHRLRALGEIRGRLRSGGEGPGQIGEEAARTSFLRSKVGQRASRVLGEPPDVLRARPGVFRDPAEVPGDLSNLAMKPVVVEELPHRSLPRAHVRDEALHVSCEPRARRASFRPRRSPPPSAGRRRGRRRTRPARSPLRADRERKRWWRRAFPRFRPPWSRGRRSRSAPGSGWCRRPRPEARLSIPLRCRRADPPPAPSMSD